MPAFSGVAAAILLAAPSQPRPVYLQTLDAAEAAGERIEAKLTGRAAQWQGQQVEWMFIRIAGAQRNWDDAPVDAADRVLITPDARGVGMIGLDLEPRAEICSAGDLRAFLEQRGRAERLPPGDAAIEVDRVESLKTIFRFGERGREQGATEATSKSGQRVEIRPLMDPTEVPPGSDLAVRAYVNSASAPGARIIATHKATGVVREALCNDSGIGHFTIHAPGAWRVELHDLRFENGRWTLYSGTLTFDSPGEGR